MEIKGCAYVAVAMLMTAWGEVGQRWHGLTSDCVKSSDSQEDEDRQVQVQSQGQFDEYGSRKYVWLKREQSGWKGNMHCLTQLITDVFPLISDAPWWPSD